ncbi:MAG: YbaN family protein [Bacteroidales bacterium]|nr:YbaN family protein [Bacteroidales bacterium]
MKRAIYIVLGSLTLVLGAIGIFVPLLPTTPFWLLTCWFYVRSSNKLYNRFLSNRYVGSYLRDYLEERTIPIRTKIIILSVLWSGSLLSVILVGNWIVAIVMLIISIAVTIHILSFRTKR